MWYIIKTTDSNSVIIMTLSTHNKKVQCHNYVRKSSGYGVVANILKQVATIYVYEQCLKLSIVMSHGNEQACEFTMLQYLM